MGREKKVTKMILTAMGKLSLFNELTEYQLVNLLSLCKSRDYQPDELVCGAGTDSTEMFLLYAGELAVITDSGQLIATIVPTTTVGEMGIITGQPRTATVKALKESETFVINKRQFEQMIQRDVSIGTKIYRNVAQSLCDKISNDNVRLRDYFAQESNFKQRLEDYRKKVDHLSSLLMERAAMGADEIEVQLKEI